MELEINEDKYLNYMVIRIKILEEKIFKRIIRIPFNCKK